MTITVTASGISLDGPLVAGEVVAVSVSGVAFAEDAKPTLCLLGRFPDALLSSVELTEDENTPGTWTGELDTATKQTAAFFAAARADEKRDAVLELVAARQSIARLSVSFANSALCPSPFHAPDASPVYVPVPGPPGQGGDPYDQNPAMDGIASAGVSDKYARGDHVHPTDSSRAAQADVAAIQDVIPSTATPSNKLATAADIPAAQVQSNWNETDTSSKAYIQNKPTSLPNPEPLHVGSTVYDGSTEYYVSNGTTDGIYGIVTLESATNSTQTDGYAATPLAVKTVADAVATKATATAIAPAFSSSSTYAVGDYVTHEGLLYKCSTAVSTAGAWDSTKWTAVNAMGEMPAPIAVDSAMSSSSTNPVQNKVVKAAVDGCVPWANAGKNAVIIGSGSVGQKSLSVGDTCVAGENSIASGYKTTAAGIASHADGYRAVTAASGNGSGASTPHDYAFAWQGVSTGGYYHSHGAGTYNINPVGGIGGFYVGEQSLGFHVNALPYASTTTLDPATAVYRATATLSGTTATMPTVTIAGIPTAAAYFAFELEVAVDATATALDDTAWSGWTWMDGGELPTADYAGKTLYIACRLDCTARTIVANCYDVR